MSRIFTVKINDTDVELRVNKPTKENLNQAKKVYNETFSEALKSKAPLRKVIFKILEEQGLWDEAKQKKMEDLRRELNSNEFILEQGGIPLKKARDIAIKLREDRTELANLLMDHTDLDSNTAEGQATDAEFSCLVSLCTVYNDSGNLFFNSYEDYLNRSEEDASIKAARELSTLMYSLSEDFMSKLPENVFLKEFKFVDDKLRLIDSQGRLISREGKLIDENGNFINEEGKRIDKFGHPLTEDGKFDVQRKPFLDDNGQPITDSNEG